MKTILISLVAIACFANVRAQQVVQENDKIVYNDHEFKVGDVVRLGYGSKQDKSFAFAHGVMYNRPSGYLAPFFSGYKCQVIGWRTYKGKYFLKARPVGLKRRIYIDVMSATDSKELAL
jgi:hypothetical protein